MAVKIAHRGNYAGVQPDRENKIDYLREALDDGYWIECDVQTTPDGLYFGHDEPQEPVDYRILIHPHTICHAKDLNALTRLMDLGAHVFWHQEDTVTLTSHRYIWCYPGQHPNHERAIWLDLHDSPIPCNTSKIFGVCSDDFTK